MTPSKIQEKLETITDLEIKCDIPWSKLTTLGVGKSVPFVAYPQSTSALAELLTICTKESLSTYVLGTGSNVVGMDRPFNGIVIKLSAKNFSSFSILNNNIHAGVNITLYNLVTSAIKHGYGGIAPLAFIPGNIGGSLRMNAGAHGSTISDYLKEVHIVTTSGEAKVLKKSDIHWAYRYSSLDNSSIITGAVFELPSVSIESEQEKLDDLKRHRKQTNAKGRNAGCVFKNPSPDTPAGKLIDQSGCKGRIQGNTQVSDVHANFIVNNGGGLESDFVHLAKQVKTTVYDKTGIYLQPEVRFVNKEAQKELAATPLTVAVLKGGTSSERDVSLESGGAVADALRSAGYKVIEIDIEALEITQEMRDADIVFPVLHGGFGENGDLQELMEQNNIEFVGCGSKACRIIMDKVISKEIMTAADLPGAPDAVLSNNDTTFPSNLKLPVVTKPPKDGSSFGISLVKTEDEWEKAVTTAYKYDDEVLVEQFIDGVELTVGVIDGKPLSAVELDYPSEIYDYDAKYTYANGQTQYHCPPVSIDDDTHKRCQETAVAFFNAVGARDVTRVDMMVNKDGEIFILEGNNLPGFTANSLLPKSAKESGKSFVELCAYLVRCASQRLINE